MDERLLLELLLRGGAVGAQLALGLALALRARNRAVRVATLVFIAANLAFVVNGAAPIRHLLGAAAEPLWVLQLGSAGLLWLFAATLFEDRALSVRAFLPAGGLVLLGLCAHFAPDRASTLLWTVHNLAGLSVALHAMALILRSGRVDLVEERRRIRVPFLAAVASYSILLSLAQIGAIAGFGASWFGLADASAQVALGLVGAAVLLEAREALFGRAVPDRAAPPGDPDRLWLERLEQAMERDGLWRREGLTIGTLADAVGLPEHRLRRLINDRLGHRNFPSFINQQRIAAAKAALSDPDSASRTVASIAYDLGFGSLGPFNRAFREATGLTPTEYRRRAQAEASPIPEKAG